MVTFSDVHSQFRDTVRRFVRNELNPYVDEWEESGCFPAHEVFAKMAKIGLLGLEYDPEYGGGGVDHLFTVILGEELGRCDAAGPPMGIAVHTDMATPALAQHGSHELKKQYLEPALQGRYVSSIAVTEPDAGSDVAGIRTFARRDGDDYVINGSKTFITNSTQADFLTLLARTSDDPGYRGMSLIIVPTNSPGFQVVRRLEKLGNWSSDTGELAFDAVRVPVQNRIGSEGRGFQLQMQQFQKERLMSCYIAVGAMDRAIERTVDYVSQRRAFGKTLAENQAIQYSLAELMAGTEMQRHFNYAAAEKLTAGEDATYLATIAKLNSGRLLRKVSDICLQYHGGAGYMADMWTSRFYRDVRLNSIGGGADEVMLRIVARAMQLPGAP